MSRVLAVSNLKGGSAKSTTTIALGAELARLGQRTLLVDMDGQGHLAEGFGIAALSLDHDISEVLEGNTTLPEILISLRTNLDLAPSNLRLAHIEPQIMGSIGRESKLRRALQPMLRRYDFVLIDCPPSVGLYTVNAFAAANEVLVPMSTEFFSLMGLSMLLDSLGKIRAGLDHQISVTGIIPTRANRTAHSREVIEQAKLQLGDGYRFFASVPEAVAVRDAAAAGQPITEYAPNSPAALAYHQIAQEVLDAT